MIVAKLQEAGGLSRYSEHVCALSLESDQYVVIPLRRVVPPLSQDHPTMPCLRLEHSRLQRLQVACGRSFALTPSLVLLVSVRYRTEMLPKE